MVFRPFRPRKTTLIHDIKAALSRQGYRAIVLAAFRKNSAGVRKFALRDFVEIHCTCSIDVCEERDVKGLYQKARAGEIKDFTGISSPYEMPENPEIRVDTGGEPLGDCVGKVVECLKQSGITGPERPVQDKQAAEL